MKVEAKRFWTRYDKVQQAPKNEEISNLEGSLYAVLFNAEEGKYSRDIKFMHSSLVNNGVEARNIIALEGNGNTKSKIISMPATFNALECSLEFIRKIAKPNDKLFFYTTNEGGIAHRQSYIQAYDKKISESEFASITQDLPVNFALFYFSNSYSGGLAIRIGYGNKVGLSSVSFTENAYGWFWHGPDFTYWLFPRILEKGITIEKAFDRAVLYNTNILKRSFITSSMHETPQLRWQNADPAKLCLGCI